MTKTKLNLKHIMALVALIFVGAASLFTGALLKPSAATATNSLNGSAVTVNMSSSSVKVDVSLASASNFYYRLTIAGTFLVDGQQKVLDYFPINGVPNYFCQSDEGFVEYATVATIKTFSITLPSTFTAPDVTVVPLEWSEFNQGMTIPLKQYSFIEGKNYSFQLAASNGFDTNFGTLFPPASLANIHNFLYSVVYELPPTPSKAGYDFVGWYLDSSLNTPYTGQPITADMNFYAKFMPIVYSIDYIVNSGTITGEIRSYTIESNAITLVTPIRNAYTFGGWFENASFTGSAVTAIPKGTKGNKTFYAKWTPTTYSINYDLDGGTLNGQTSSYNVESSLITLATPTKTGYTFKGWWDNALFTGEQVYNISTGSYGNKTFYAKWEINKYTINFDTVGTSVSSVTTNYNTTISAPTTALEGHTFKGWFKDAECTQQFNFTTPITANMTLYAKFEVIKFTITFYVDGQIYHTMEVDWGTTLSQAVQQLEQSIMQFVLIIDNVDIYEPIYAPASLSIDTPTGGFAALGAKADYIWANYWYWFIVCAAAVIFTFALILKAKGNTKNKRYRPR